MYICRCAVMVDSNLSTDLVLTSVEVKRFHLPVQTLDDALRLLNKEIRNDHTSNYVNQYFYSITYIPGDISEKYRPAKEEENPHVDTENPKIKRHKEICDEIHKLYERKNHDYGDSFHQTFIDEGMAMARIRLGDKFSRFKALTLQGDQQVSDESIRDTLIDLANYAIMTVLEMEEGDN